jgi:hypothetical protein
MMKIGFRSSPAVILALVAIVVVSKEQRKRFVQMIEHSGMSTSKQGTDIEDDEDEEKKQRNRNTQVNAYICFSLFE